MPCELRWTGTLRPRLQAPTRRFPGQDARHSGAAGVTDCRKPGSASSPALGGRDTPVTMQVGCGHRGRSLTLTRTRRVPCPRGPALAPAPPPLRFPCPGLSSAPPTAR